MATCRDAHGDAIDNRQGARGVCSVRRLLLSARAPCLPGALLRGSPSMPPGPCWLFRKISLSACKSLLAGGADSEPQPRRPRGRDLTSRRCSAVAAMRAAHFRGPLGLGAPPALARRVCGGLRGRARATAGSLSACGASRALRLPLLDAGHALGPGVLSAHDTPV